MGLRLYNNQDYINATATADVDGEWIDTAHSSALHISAEMILDGSGMSNFGYSLRLVGTNFDDFSREVVVGPTAPIFGVFAIDQGGAASTNDATQTGSINIYERLPRWVRMRYAFTSAGSATGASTLRVAAQLWTV